MVNPALRELILSNIRTKYAMGEDASTSKQLYSLAGKRKYDAIAVDDALKAMVAAGTVRICAGFWFEVGQNTDTTRVTAERRRKIAEKRDDLGKPRDGRKVDNRKATKAPRGMRKSSAASRTVELPGTK